LAQSVKCVGDDLTTQFGGKVVPPTNSVGHLVGKVRIQHLAKATVVPGTSQLDGTGIHASSIRHTCISHVVAKTNCAAKPIKGLRKTAANRSARRVVG
jgi:hypothetical protein